MNNPYIDLVKAFERKDFYIVSRIPQPDRIGLRLASDYSHLDVKFRQRVERMLHCPNFNLGQLFADRVDPGCLDDDTIQGIQDHTYDALFDEKLKLPFPVCAWVTHTPSRQLHTVAFLGQMADGSIHGHVFIHKGEPKKWALIPATMTNGIAIESHLDTFGLSEDNAFWIDHPYHWGLYGATMLDKAGSVVKVEDIRDPNVAALNTQKAKKRAQPIPHPRIIRVNEPDLLKRVVYSGPKRTHASPVEHVRRGHWRSKPGGNGKVWVRETTVNGKPMDLNPSYKLVSVA